MSFLGQKWSNFNEIKTRTYVATYVRSHASMGLDSNIVDCRKKLIFIKKKYMTLTNFHSDSMAESDHDEAEKTLLNSFFFIQSFKHFFIETIFSLL